MKLIKKKMIYCISLMLAGIILICAAYIKGDDSILMGMGVGMAAIALLKTIQFFRLSRDPEKLKKYELMQNEERLILIVTRSGYLTFLITVAAEYIAMLVLVITGQEQIASIVCGIAGLQVLCYLLMYFFYNKKY
ncbi:MAG: hypothetical protein Q4G60_14150 [bacterium]|nr:hypothetical protein [bacterium]